jgi:transcriptional regulator GlxA family with amidase domain
VNRLLRNTDLTIEAIADLTGFVHPHYLQTAYRDRYGLTPGRFRRNHRNHGQARPDTA